MWLVDKSRLIDFNRINKIGIFVYLATKNSMISRKQTKIYDIKNVAKGFSEESKFINNSALLISLRNSSEIDFTKRNYHIPQIHQQHNEKQKSNKGQNARKE